MTPRDETRKAELRREGVAVSAGVAIGRAFLVGRDLIKEPRYHVEADDVDTEIARLRKAIAAADKQLGKIKDKLAASESSSASSRRSRSAPRPSTTTSSRPTS